MVAHVGFADVGVADDGVEHVGFADVGVTDDGVADVGVANDWASDDGVTDDGVAKHGVAYVGVADDGVADVASDVDKFCGLLDKNVHHHSAIIVATKSFVHCNCCFIKHSIDHNTVIKMCYKHNINIKLYVLLIYLHMSIKLIQEHLKFKNIAL